MVVHKGTKSVNIFKRGLLLVVEYSEGIHRVTRTIDIVKRKEHWIVEESSHMVLVVSDVRHTSIKDFAHLEYSRCSTVF